MKKSTLTPARTLLMAVAAAVMLQTPTTTQADNRGYNKSNRVVVYFTRHAEKMTRLKEAGDIPGHLVEDCGVSKCAEVLNAKGEFRAELLVEWFERRGITKRLTHAYSSHKVRTLQTIVGIAQAAGLQNDTDLIADGVQQLPAFGTELNPESTGPSVDPVVVAIQNLSGGSVALVAGHSGTLYKIMDQLGLDTTDAEDYPRNPQTGKVADFGDIWKVVLRNGKVRLAYRVNLQPTRLRVVD